MKNFIISLEGNYRDLELLANLLEHKLEGRVGIISFERTLMDNGDYILDLIDRLKTRRANFRQLEEIVAREEYDYIILINFTLSNLVDFYEKIDSKELLALNKYVVNNFSPYLSLVILEDAQDQSSQSLYRSCLETNLFGYLEEIDGNRKKEEILEDIVEEIGIYNLAEELLRKNILI